MTDLEIINDVSADYGEQRAAATRIVVEKYAKEIKKKTCTDFKIIPILNNKDFTRLQTVGYGDRLIAEWQLSPFPGNNSIVVSSNALVGFDFRRRGLGLLTTTMREEIAALAGFSMIMATTAETNLFENHILISRKWELKKDYKVGGYIRSQSFYNHRNNHNVCLWTKILDNVTVNN